MSTLKIENLHVSIDDREILKGIDLTINTGEIHDHEDGKNGEGSRISGKTDPDPVGDQRPVRAGLEMCGTVRGRSGSFSERKRTGLGWHLSCFSIKWILFVVYNKPEFFGNFRIFIVK
mgnify:CR=1 FL=1